ncbi:MAG: aldehyde dehydrogenase family protein, partial [Acidobacteria bacterium]|nr:aldehyde dehydrogenase family protein [Acidobacteriota bacterium]
MRRDAPGDDDAPTDHDVADRRALDAAVSALGQSAPRWAATSPGQRARMLARAIADTHGVGYEWNEAACRAKGLDPQGPDGGEELLAGVGMFVRLMSAYRHSLLDIARRGRPRYPGRVRHRAGNRLAVPVLPASLLDRILFFGDRAEVWMEPGVNEEELRANQAAVYARPWEHAGVVLVLGAGNVASLAPRDVVHQLMGEGRVVILKANPVNEYLVEYWRRALAVFIEAGVVHIVTGGADVGDYLAHHPGIDAVHLTGAAATYDAVVFGPAGSGANPPRLTKPVTAELGNVSPVIIVPGPWTRREIEYQAAHVATMMVNNAGFNCLTPRVIVTHSGWTQREEFLEALERVLATVPPRRAYYPGAVARRDRFLAVHPDARQIGQVTPGTMAWTLVRDVDAANVEDPCFRDEAFCALTSETSIDAASPEDFVRRAVDFCNDVLHGTLSLTVLISPRTLRRAAMGAALDRALADLRYGTIGVNVWHGLGIMVATTPWGAYPGHVATDIQSGVGVVGNTFMLARSQKAVVRGPFVARPTPPWFITHRRSAVAMRRLFEVQCTESWIAVPRLL